MRRVAFIGYWDPSALRVTRLYKSMTPGCSGKWKTLQAVEDWEQADVIVVLDRLRPDRAHLLFGKRVIGLSREPHSYEAKKWPFDPTSYYGYDRHHHAVGSLSFLGLTFDQAASFVSGPKSKVLSCICSSQEFLPGHRLRKSFVKYLSKQDVPCDIFGSGWRQGELGSLYLGPLGSYHDRGRDQNQTTKVDGLAPYQYSICIENTCSRNYFTEKITDCFICGTVPIYFGCPNIEDYFPPLSYRKIDIRSKTALQDLKRIVSSPPCEQTLLALRQARDLVLQKYNVWECVFNILGSNVLRDIGFVARVRKSGWTSGTFFAS